MMIRKMKLVTFQAKEMIMIMEKVVLIRIWNFTMQWEDNMLQSELQNLTCIPGTQVNESSITASSSYSS